MGIYGDQQKHTTTPQAAAPPACHMDDGGTPHTPRRAMQRTGPVWYTVASGTADCYKPGPGFLVDISGQYVGRMRITTLLLADRGDTIRVRAHGITRRTQCECYLDLRLASE